MTFTVAGDTSTVTLNNPMSISFITSRRLEKHTFRDNTYNIHDAGKSHEQIALNGIESEDEVGAEFPLTFPVTFPNIEGDMYNLNVIMDAGEEVTIAGLSDSNLDGDYYIKDLNYRQEPGVINRFFYNLILEKT